MSDEKMNELVARYRKALPERIRTYLHDCSKPILISYKRKFNQLVLGSKSISVVSAMAGQNET